MIKQFIERFENNKGLLAAKFGEKHPEQYDDIVKSVIEVVTDEGDYTDFSPDPERVHQIDDGEYKGTLVFVIGAKEYQPSDYWYVKVSYGSCSGCDTLQSICGYRDEKPTDEQVSDYMTLALHVVQGLKKMGDDVA